MSASLSSGSAIRLKLCLKPAKRRGALFDLAPELGLAHALKAQVDLCLDYDWAGSERSFRRAIELSPDRAILLDVPPSINAHELTDKGSISQRAVLENRAEAVEELYRGSPRVISIDDSEM